MAEDPTHITDEEDMASFDKLPRALRDYLRDAPAGHQATPVLVYYEELVEKMCPLYSEYEVQQRLMKALKEYERREGFKGLPVLRVRPGAKKHRERTVRVPKWLMRTGDR
jgi:hypothetical protein